MYLKQSKLIWSIDWEVGWDKENSKLIWKDTGKTWNDTFTFNEKGVRLTKISTLILFSFIILDICKTVSTRCNKIT